MKNIAYILSWHDTIHDEYEEASAFNHTSYSIGDSDVGPKSNQSKWEWPIDGGVPGQGKEIEREGRHTPSGGAGDIRRAIPHKNQKNWIILLGYLTCHASAPDMAKVISEQHETTVIQYA